MTFLRFPFKSNKISIKKGKVRGFWREYRKAARRFDAKDSDRLIHRLIAIVRERNINFYDERQQHRHRW